MESIEKLMLRIEGGETNEPLKTLLNVGDAPDNMRLAPSLISLDQSWRIVHAQMFTAYGLWSPATTASGTTGHLQITLYVPPMQQLANSANPLDVLNAVIDLMGVKDSNGLRLPDMPLDSVPFEQLLKKYDLEERPMPLPVMAGNVPGTFCVSNEAQLRALMRFSRYPVLEKVSQLELGYNCTTTVEINTKADGKRSNVGGNNGSGMNKPHQIDTPQHLQGNSPQPTDEASPLSNDMNGGHSLDTPQETPQDDPLFAMGVNQEPSQPSSGGDNHPADMPTGLNTVKSLEESDAPIEEGAKSSQSLWQKVKKPLLITTGAVALIAVAGWLVATIVEEKNQKNHTEEEWLEESNQLIDIDIDIDYDNYNEALLKKAQSGNDFAQFKLGACYEYGKGITQDYNEALKWYRKAAEQGYSAAQISLGHCYEHGNGVTQDYNEAVKWYRKAAEQGFADAENIMGHCYEYGKGVTQDYNEAVKWYRKAAEQDYALAQSNLGVCYYNGHGVTQDYNEAVKWYSMAAGQGNASGQNNLGACYEYGKGVTQDYNEALKWYRKAAEQGDANAQYKLGNFYKRGKGVTQDYNETVKWYRMAAEQGNAQAQNGMGYCYGHGLGVTKDCYEEVKWYRMAAEQGNATAQFNLAYCYEHAEGVTKDISQAVEWYRKAAEQGDADAQKALKRLGYSQ